MLVTVSLVLIVAGQFAMLFLTSSLEKRIRKCEEQCRYLAYRYEGLECERKVLSPADSCVAEG